MHHFLQCRVTVVLTFLFVRQLCHRHRVELQSVMDSQVVITSVITNYSCNYNFCCNLQFYSYTLLQL
jgi:hypothetical protein